MMSFSPRRKSVIERGKRTDGNLWSRACAFSLSTSVAIRDLLFFAVIANFGFLAKKFLDHELFQSRYRPLKNSLISVRMRGLFVYLLPAEGGSKSDLLPMGFFINSE